MEVVLVGASLSTYWFSVTETPRDDVYVLSSIENSPLFLFFLKKKPSFTLYRKNLLIFVSSIVQIICGITKLLSLASCGQRLTNAVKKAKSQLLLKKHGLLQTCDKHEKGPLELQEIDLLYKKLEDNSSLQPCNCFALHYGSLVTGFTVLLTFAIVLFQFRATDKTDVLCGCFNSTTIP